MNNAEKKACDVLYKPKSSKYLESIRMFQGCPTLAVTKGGRIYMGWYAGGLREPHMNNYNLLIYSDDKGATWSEPLLVIPSSYENSVHALDIQLFIDPDGSLHVLWVQNNTTLIPENKPFLTIPVDKQDINIIVSDIMYVLSDLNYCLVYTKQKEYRTRSQFGKFMEMLSEFPEFYVINRGIAVNLDNVLDIKELDCELSDKTILPVSKKQKLSAEQALIDRRFQVRRKAGK